MTEKSMKEMTKHLAKKSSPEHEVAKNSRDDGNTGNDFGAAQIDDKSKKSLDTQMKQQGNNPKEGQEGGYSKDHYAENSKD